MGDTAAIAAAVPRHVLERFEQRGGVRYRRTYISADAPQGTTGPSGAPALSWQERTGASDRDAAARFFRDLGFDVDWRDGGATLVATHVAPAVVPHPVTGQRLWFNLTHLAVPGWTDYGDGSPIEPGALWVRLGASAWVGAWVGGWVGGWERGWVDGWIGVRAAR
jgi:hypothetical protein